MRFKGLDLNLLVALDALLDTRSVSRAAARLNLTQPAVSAALKRLREYFGDEILVSHGKRMFPTALAEGLLPHLRDSLRTIEGLIDTSTGFDPATSERAFRICCSDYMATAIFAPLSRRLARDAPRIRLDMILNDDQALGQLEQGAIDLLVLPDGFTERVLPSEPLLDERHVVVGCRDNPLFPDRLDRAAFLAARHVRIAIGFRRTLVFGDRELEILGIERQIDVVAASFGIVPWLVMGTSRMALMHERLALAMAEHLPIAIAPLPFDIPPMREVVQFHGARANDPALCWLREQIQQQARME